MSVGSDLIHKSAAMILFFLLNTPLVFAVVRGIWTGVCCCNCRWN